MDKKDRIANFLQAEHFAVAGASTKRDKYGNKVLRSYLEHGYKVIPINPTAALVEGIPSVSSVAELPAEVTALSIITPPQVTRKVVAAAIELGHIKHIWMQPGAEDKSAVELCETHNINVIADGSCLLVEIGFSEGH
ncbi:MAG: CoA-binding protein [Desulfuromonadaceae bacterium]|nr:CoA-binding protein [Desulfuromonas sp.]MDY0185518.1 CoA-binding protein [Desulfuromonadaceae bacterium]